MAKIVVDSEQFNVALQMFYSGKDKLEDADFRYKNLKKEFDADPQLLAAPEYIEIENICQQMDSSFFRLREQVETLSLSLATALQAYEETEKKAEDKIKEMKNRCDLLQVNANDAVNAAIVVEKDQNEELKRLNTVSQMVQNDSFDLSMASTATVAHVTNKNKKVEEVDHNKLAQDVKTGSSSVSSASFATSFNEQKDKSSDEASGENVRAQVEKDSQNVSMSSTATSVNTDKKSTSQEKVGATTETAEK